MTDRELDHQVVLALGWEKISEIDGDDSYDWKLPDGTKISCLNVPNCSTDDGVAVAALREYCRKSEASFRLGGSFPWAKPECFYCDIWPANNHSFISFFEQGPKLANVISRCIIAAHEAGKEKA